MKKQDENRRLNWANLQVSECRSDVKSNQRVESWHGGGWAFGSQKTRRRRAQLSMGVELVDRMDKANTALLWSTFFPSLGRSSAGGALGLSLKGNPSMA